MVRRVHTVITNIVKTIAVISGYNCMYLSAFLGQCNLRMLNGLQRKYVHKSYMGALLKQAH